MSKRKPEDFTPAENRQDIQTLARAVMKMQSDIFMMRMLNLVMFGAIVFLILE